MGKQTIQALPDELFTLIFRSIAKSCGQRRYEYGKDGFLSCSHVCSRWRHIVDSTPQLWSYIITCNAAMVLRCIQHSGAALLEVDVVGGGSPVVMAAMMEEPVLSRIRALRRTESVQPSMRALEKAILPALLSKPRPNLVELVIVTNLDIVIDVDVRTTPALQRLSMSPRFHIVLSPHAFSNLRYLSVEYGAQIQVPRLDLDLFLDSLQGCMLLESLHIHDHGSDLRNPPSSKPTSSHNPLYFPSLQDFQCRTSDISTHYFLNSIIFPDTRFSCTVSAKACSTFHKAIPESSNILSLLVNDDSGISLDLLATLYPHQHHASIQIRQEDSGHDLRRLMFQGDTLTEAELIEFVSERCGSVNIKHLLLSVMVDNQERAHAEVYVRLYEAFPNLETLWLSCSSYTSEAAIRAVGRSTMRHLSHIDVRAVYLPAFEILAESMKERFHSGRPIQSVKIDVGTFDREESVIYKRILGKVKQFVPSVTESDNI